MSKVTIQGDASGTGIFTIASPNSNTDRTLVLPDEAGTILTATSSIPAANLIGTPPVGFGYTYATAACTGSSVVFNGIPANVRRISIAWNYVSPSASTEVHLRLGTSSGLATNGYENTSLYTTSGTPVVSYNTESFKFAGWTGTINQHNVIFNLLNVGGGIWMCNGTFQNPSYTTYYTTLTGRVNIGDTLTQVAAVVTTGSFDNGTMAVFYE